MGYFIYLRRIFEFLLDEAYQIALKNKKISTYEYQKARVGEQIKLLSNVLLDSFIEYAELYGILSKHIHELSEDEFLEDFDTVLFH